MSGKKKAQKMSLSDFLADDNGGASWADEMASLPSAPVKEEADGGFGSPRGDRFARDRGFDLPRGPAGGDGGFERRDRFSAPRPDRFAPRAPVELPTEPPFTAHIANLSFEANEDDLADFFGQMKIASIRILRDREERSKGFGYVEFEDLDSLKGALELTGESLQGRTIRVNVAEPPKDRPERAPRQPDRTDVNTWRRETPVELPERRGGFRGGRGGGSSGGGFQDRRGGDNSWSGGAFARRDDRFGSRDAPAERPRLNLKPRSTDAPASSSAASSNNKPSPFGAAKPVDTDSALKKIEDKLTKTTLEEDKKSESGQEP
ncbi:hypothetical protein BDB00DRAFT_791961 [Zychaea mexicana]|uniref:uncharacterized protein n=1 Tax=Zychaea mexicana TaxID=64656 RepID=UPI0022FF26BE|nr:uncharacterized protein BDB00DRAFT_791961 [Zychaea mexicana]KAI9488317.1 hypothetical protein BDB00DRAFT_791961 [Zychaea mexicana]